MPDELEPRPKDDLAALIRQAFAEAAASGKSGTEMTTAVLKNRLLQLTGKKFREPDYGHSTLARLLLSVPWLVQLKGDHPPYMVHLLDRTVGAAGQQASADDEAVRRPVDERYELWRVREDLWKAAMDSYSGLRYVWDAQTGSAMVAEKNDPRPTFLTVPRDRLDETRSDFANRYLDPEAAGRWIREQGGGLKALPLALRRQWVAELKRFIIDQLRTWFRSNAIPEPRDLLIPATGAPAVSRQAGADRPAIALEELRQVVMQVIAVMTESELAALLLPAPAVTRSRFR